EETVVCLKQRLMRCNSDALLHDPAVARGISRQEYELTQLTEALRKLGFEVSELNDRLALRKQDSNGYYRAGSYDRANAQLELDNTWDVNEIKRAYSERVVESQARKFGRQLEWSTSAAGHRQASVLRRG